MYRPPTPRSRLIPHDCLRLVYHMRAYGTLTTRSRLGYTPPLVYTNSHRFAFTLLYAPARTYARFPFWFDFVPLFTVDHTPVRSVCVPTAIAFGYARHCLHTIRSPGLPPPFSTLHGSAHPVCFVDFVRFRFYGVRRSFVTISPTLLPHCCAFLVLRSPDFVHIRDVTFVVDAALFAYRSDLRSPRWSIPLSFTLYASSLVACIPVIPAGVGVDPLFAMTYVGITATALVPIVTPAAVLSCTVVLWVCARFCRLSGLRTPFPLVYVCRRFTTLRFVAPCMPVDYWVFVYAGSRSGFVTITIAFTFVCYVPHAAAFTCPFNTTFVD